MNTLIKAIAALAAVISLNVSAFAADDDSSGKTMCVFGDSYVANHLRPYTEAWHSKVAERMGMKYINFGRNGSSIAFDRSKEGFGREMTERYKELPDSIDILLVIAGHNDADWVAKYGGWDKFTKSLDTLCRSLKERYPDTAIGFVTPWNVDRPYFKELIEEIISTCGRYGIPVLDAAHTSGIDVNNPEFRAKYFQGGGVNDTAHLNAAGHDLLLDYGEKFIRSLVK